MAVRNKYVFVTPVEFEQWVREAAQYLNACIILWELRNPQLVEWDGRSEELFRAFRIYFAEERLDLTHLNANDVTPGQLGWFEVDVPVVKGPHLVGISLGVKSAWEDWDNPGVIKFFDRFWRRWKKHFRFGLISKNIKFGWEGLNPNFGYSPGAADWVQNGGILTQEVGSNGIFVLPPEQSA